jgi:glycerol-3-phosphate dehydrogenase
MNSFPRDLDAALNRRYDLIVIGGGIYGMCLTLEAARHGLRPLLLERGDFGGATSCNTLRILHGGLRYLQSLDVPRFFESVEQRSWFMTNFRPLCRVLPCLMPLYGKGLRRPAIFGAALALNDMLARDPDFSGGRVLGVAETIERFPAAPRAGLKGGALWYDGQILSPQRVHAELLRWATVCGATVLNYVEARELQRKDRCVAGVVTNAGTFFAPVVINAAGPWSREMAQRLDCDQPALIAPSLAFNVLLDVEPPSDAAVAVQGSRTYFVTPHRNGTTFAGTVHRAWQGLSKPSDEMIDEFLEDLDRAIPNWGLDRSNVIRVTAGVLPASRLGKADMAHHSTFVRHEIDGLFSVCGIKYTTAQRFARRTIERIFGSAKSLDPTPPEIGDRVFITDPRAVMALADEDLRRLAHEEAVTNVEDFVERRMDWILDENERSQFEARLIGVLGIRSAKVPGEMAMSRRNGASGDCADMPIQYSNHSRD